MLLIFFGVFSYFFDVKDYTIIAGIIAFVGAVIGGTITLVGVNKTLLENRRRERLIQIPEIIKILKEEVQFIRGFQMDFHIEVEINDVDGLGKFLLDSRSKLDGRRDEQNILACGEEIYNLYNNILTGTLDLLVVTLNTTNLDIVPKIKTTSAYWDICMDYYIACERTSKHLEKEYFSLAKNL